MVSYQGFLQHLHAIDTPIFLDRRSSSRSFSFSLPSSPLQAPATSHWPAVLSSCSGCVFERSPHSLIVPPLASLVPPHTLSYHELLRVSGIIGRGHRDQGQHVRRRLHWTGGILSVRFDQSFVRESTFINLHSLFGVLCSQTFTYLHRYPLDRPFYKILVCCLTVVFVCSRYLRRGSLGCSNMVCHRALVVV